MARYNVEILFEEYQAIVENNQDTLAGKVQVLARKNKKLWEEDEKFEDNAWRNKRRKTDGGNMC